MVVFKGIDMKKFAFALLLLSSLLTCLSYAEVIPLDAVVAKVNKQIITQSELDAKISDAKSALQQQGIQAPSQRVLAQRILDTLILQKLQLQTAERLQITTTQQELRQAIATIAQQRNMSAQQLINAVKQSGMSTQQFTQQVRQQVIMHKLQQQIIAPKVSVKPEEVEEAIKNLPKAKNDNLYRIEDIFIALPDAPTPQQINQANTRANAIMARLKKGESFKTLAVEQSSGQQALQGGDLGWRQLTELPAVFASKVEGLSKGGVAGPIRAANGVHIIRLVDIKQGRSVASPAQRKKQVEQMLFRRKFEQQLESWLQQLRDSAYINIEDPKLRAR